MTQIITITPSPAIDVSTSVGKMAPYTKLRCAPPLRDPGGGGINVARAVQRLGGDVAAIYPAGGAAGQSLRRLVDRESVASLAFTAEEETREDFTVLDRASGEQFRFVLPGSPLSPEEWQECLGLLARAKPAPQCVVASGSLPAGMPDDFYARVARVAKEIGAKVIVDTSGPALKSALAEGVHLIKPNLREFCELTGIESRDDAALIAASRDLIARGKVELIALSLGAGGAMLIARDIALRADGLPIKPVSVVGAGDSFLGALALSLMRGRDPEAALRYGVAAGSAALLNPGTELCRLDDVERLAPQVVIRPAGAS